MHRAGVAEGSKCGSMVMCSGGSITPVSERVSEWPKVELWEDFNIFSWFGLPGVSMTYSIASIIMCAMHVKNIKHLMGKKA